MFLLGIPWIFTLNLIHHVTALNSNTIITLNSIELNAITGVSIEFYITTWNSIEFSVYIVFKEVELTLD